MIVKQYIKNFEKLGFGMFVHFGLYSILGCGEWAKLSRDISDADYFKLMEQFDPKLSWAEDIVNLAKKSGCRYITLTTRHHDGFSLYDTCGLNDYDSVHSKCGRDLVREFVDACNKENITPFFYHTLLDWHEPSYNNDFKKYLAYLRNSIKLLFTNYGNIGGIWFDGMWDKNEEDWEEDALYGVIRELQPNAMIINNTGLSARGELGHIELDSVTFERGNPSKINMLDSPKYIASEMCEVFAEHWGFAKDDLRFKSPALIIEELVECRKFGSNFLLNLGPMGSGDIRKIDEAAFEIIGQWMNYFGVSISDSRPCDIIVKNKLKDFLLKKDEKTYYLFCFNIPMYADANVNLVADFDYREIFDFNLSIKSVYFIDDNTELEFSQNGSETTIITVPYKYGRDLVVRVAQINL